MEKEFRTILKHLNKINSYKALVTPENYQNTMSSLYKYVKSITPFYCDKNGLLPYYKEIRQQVINIESMIEDNTITDTTIPFYYYEKTESFLDYLIHKTRIFLTEDYYGERCSEQLIKVALNNNFNLDLADYCQKSAEYIDKTCKKNNVGSTIICIAPAYEDTARIYYGCGYHYFNIIIISNDYYLVDATYSQFFSARSNNINRLGVLYLSGCDVGTFMLMTIEGQKIAEEIIKKGYVKLTEEILKIYLDAFTVSYRNGLFYERTKDFSYTADYTFEDYANFITEKDNQLNHEDIETLGIQRKPLQNSRLKFNKKL